MDMPEMITCRDCGTLFAFTTGEQRFFESRGWEKPFRCEACREAKKRRRAEAEKYAGIRETMRSSSYKKRDTKGTFINRSGSTFESVSTIYWPFGDILEYDDLTDPDLIALQDCYGRPSYFDFLG